MNWHLEVRAPLAKLRAALRKAEPQLSYAEGEREAGFALPAGAVDAALALAAGTAGKAESVLVTLAGHRALEGEGFRPAHVSVTVSKLDPGEEAPAAQPGSTPT